MNAFCRALERQYPDEWVLVEYTKLDRNLHALGGKVLAHSRSRKQTYKALLHTKGKNVSIEYFGEPPDIPVMFELAASA